MGPLKSVSAVPPGMSRRTFIQKAMEDRLFLSEWGAAYEGTKNLAIGQALDDPRLLKRFASSARLPRGFGFAIDERIVEFPWVLAMKPSGKVLDAGSALNQRVMLDHLVNRLESLTISTFTPESEDLEYEGVRYVGCDLRALPFEDGEFDTVISVSTLEHVGMDNSAYGSDEPRSDDPDRELERAVGELKRVLAPGGRLVVTVPYGRAEDHGWLRQFDRAGLEQLAGWLAGKRPSLDVYRHSDAGWQRASVEKAANAHYRDHREEPIPGPDLTFAAEAVACLASTRSTT